MFDASIGVNLNMEGAILMKCIKNIKPLLVKGEFKAEVVRCSDKTADKLVSSGKWFYVSKSAWKRSGRKYL